MPSSPSAPFPAVTEQSLHYLVCPVCHATVQLAPADVLCTGCGRRYPIVDGLPVLLKERAQ